MLSFESSFTLGVPSSTQNLGMIRDFVSRISEKAGLTRPETLKIELAVDEACANVIEHAYGNDVTKTVIVQVSFDEDSLQVKVIDLGKGFDPELIKPEEIEQLIAQRRSGGLGMRLMRSIMDEVRYEIEPGKKNELRMIKRLRKT